MALNSYDPESWQYIFLEAILEVGITTCKYCFKLDYIIIDCPKFIKMMKKVENKKISRIDQDNNLINDNNIETNQNFS